MLTYLSKHPFLKLMTPHTRTRALRLSFFRSFFRQAFEGAEEGGEAGDEYRVLSGGAPGSEGSAAAGGGGGGGARPREVEESNWGNWDPIPRIRVVERSRFV